MWIGGEWFGMWRSQEWNSIPECISICNDHRRGSHLRHRLPDQDVERGPWTGRRGSKTNQGNDNGRSWQARDGEEQFGVIVCIFGTEIQAWDERAAGSKSGTEMTAAIGLTNR